MAELFETGKIYTFYFSGEGGKSNLTGQVLSYESPLVKVETEGLIRVINCSSASFIEAVTRREEVESGEEPAPE